MEWGVTERSVLGEMWLAGRSHQEIARAVGTTVPAVRTKAGRLGLPDAFERRRGETTGTLRACKCCEETFFSTWKGNRHCIRCKSAH